MKSIVTAGGSESMIRGYTPAGIRPLNLPTTPLPIAIMKYKSEV